MSNSSTSSVTSAELAARHGIDLSSELSRGFAGRLIRRKAAQLIGKTNLVATDRDDLEQDLRIALMAQLPKFDPTKAHWNAFVTVVVNRQVARLLEYRKRKKRGYTEHVVSLSAQVPGENGEPTELSRMIRPEQQGFLVAMPLHDNQEAFEVEHDVSLVMSKLTDEQRDLCRHLMHRSVTEAARILRIPRSTIQDRVQEIRQVFAKYELEEYLEK